MSKEAKECSCSWRMLVNQWVTSAVFFHWLSFVFSPPDFRVDVDENLFADFSEFAFCGIYEAACRVVGEVVFHKKASKDAANIIDLQAKSIARRAQHRQPYRTNRKTTSLKDHKDNFANHPTCRLV